MIDRDPRQSSPRLGRPPRHRFSSASLQAFISKPDLGTGPRGGGKAKRRRGYQAAKAPFRTTWRPLTKSSEKRPASRSSVPRTA